MTAPILFEFCCRASASNLNAGTRFGTTTEPGISADITYASGTWVQSTRVFTPASGNPISAGVLVGDRVSIYPDGTTPDGVYFAEVSARDSTTITMNASKSFGTAPTNGTNNRTLKLGGAWRGPTGASGFPFNLITADSGSYFPRVNVKNNQTYNITAQIAWLNSGSVKAQGYTTSYGDFGLATIDGGTSGASYTHWLLNGGNNHMTADFIFQNNGATGAAPLVDGQGLQANVLRCVFRHSCGSGITGFVAGAFGCEAYDVNLNNGSNLGGFVSCGWTVNCVSHHNTGSNTIGFSNCKTFRSIADTNGGVGFKNCSSFNCDAYKNGSDGFLQTGGSFYFENNNAIKNGGYGLNAQNGSIGTISEYRYGAGTMANTSGGMNIGATAAVERIGTQSAYPNDVHPWADPDNGDFRIIRPEAIATGRGTYMSIDPSFTGTRGYPDIGAAQARVMYRGKPRLAGGING